MKFLSGLLLLGLLSSCNTDPYPKIDNTADGGRNQDDRRDDEEPPKDPLSMAIDSEVVFTEGRQLEYQFRVEVGAPGKAEVWIDDLPEGATFDPETLIIRWKPGYFAGNNPKDPTIKTRGYPIKVWLRSSILVERSISEKVTLTVKDTPRAVQVIGDDSESVYEDSELRYDFEIKNLDYPNGPFKVFTKNMPANSTVVKIDETNYSIRFTPDYYHVNLKVDGSSVDYSSKIIVTNPANHVGNKEVKIVVNDKRLGVHLQTPNTEENPVLEQGLDASFQVAAYDLNKEVTPKISLKRNYPKFGHFDYKLVENPDSNSSVLNVNWMDIPPIYNGKTIGVDFEACVLSSRNSYYECETKTVKIKVVVKERKSPYINRDNWKVGELLYLGFQESEHRKVLITDGEDYRLKPKVEIFPIAMRDHVEWYDGSIRMNFDIAGTHQFHVKATSGYKTSTTESFIVEVFPKDRSKVLFFADSTRDPEVKFYKKNLKDVSLMNPLIQKINLRNVSNRETLVLGTSVLFDKEANPQILKAMDEIENIVIASPLIDNMPKSFLTELKDDYNLGFIGRWNSIPRTPDLSKTFFAFTKHFDTPLKKVGLKLSSSTESSNPLIFNGGLDDPDKICKGVLGLTVDGNNPLVIGVTCERKYGGKITLLGTEWADLKVSEEDLSIPSSWFNTMLKGRF
jgi:hypothetical protein